MAKRGGAAPASSGGGDGGCGGLGGGLGAGGCGGSRLGWQASKLVAPVTPPVYSVPPHGVDCVAPSTGQYVSTGQAWHAVATLLSPGTVPNVPTGHGAHAPPSMPYVPAPHWLHALAPPAEV
jgi:hypothetical protein